MGEALRSANVRLGAPAEAPAQGEILRRLGSGAKQFGRNLLLETQSAFSLPGDVWAGRVAPGSEEGLDRANMLAGTMAGGALPISRAAGPVGPAVGMFVGPKAKTADLSKLGSATLLEKRGAAPEEIWRQTGWFRGADKKWRSEISDEGAHLFNDARTLLEEGKSFRAGQIGGFHHYDLYRAYPELIRTDIHPYPHEGNWGTSYGGNIGIKRDLDLPQQRSTLLHEFQHEIQGIEGWNRGGQASMFQLTPEKEADLVGQWQRLRSIRGFQDALQQGWTPQQLQATFGVEDTWQNLPIAQQTSPQLIQLELEMLERQLQWGRQEGHVGYRSLAGEVEARNVQAREKLTERGRQLGAPFLSEDLPRSEQIVMDQQGRITGMGYELVPVEGDPFQR